MYLDFLVDIPDVSNKITYRKKSGNVYVYYEYERLYDKTTKKTNPKRATIGKRSEKDHSKMYPNQNFLKYFPDAKLPEDQDRTLRSSCLRIGDYIVIRKILEDYKLPELLRRFLKSDKNTGLFMDLVAYTIVCENNAGQYYPNYAYNHPLFADEMHIYSDSRVSDFLNSLTEDASIGFLNEWNGSRDHSEKIYMSYDATNKNCEAGDIEIVEYGHPKVDAGLPIFNYSIAYDTDNKEPLFYEKYPGSINDMSQLEFMVDKAYGYGYRKIGFILDRGYFSQSNLKNMDEKGYSFVIMVKGMATFINGLIKENRGTFETKRLHFIDEYEVYGITAEKKLYESDEKTRWIHIYHSVQKESAERAQVESKIRKMKQYLHRHLNEARDFGTSYEKYFYLHHDKDTNAFVWPEERMNVIEEELELCGYFCIITSEKMTAKEAINLYKSRDASEKLFRGDKSYLGNRSLRVHSDEAADAKIFIEFVALIVRNRIYNSLKEKLKTMEQKPNYMTVPAAMKELEKIEMIRLTDNIYRLDHAVTKTQKIILSAFGIDVPYVKYMAAKISKQLQNK